MALAMMAAEPAQYLGLLIGFNSLRNDLDVHMLRNGNNGTDNCHVARVRRQFPHEALVDLQDVHSPMLEIGETGVAGTEVIYRYSNTQLAQIAHALQSVLPRTNGTRIEKTAFRHFQQKQVSRYIVRLEQSGYLCLELALDQLGRCDIQRNGDQGAPRAPPRPHILQHSM